METAELNNWEDRFIEYLETHHDTKDGSHDLFHFQRVWKTAQYINSQETDKADLLVLLAGCYFHDLISYPKNDARRSLSSLHSAEKTVEILDKDFTDFPKDKIDAVKHAIHAHSFSANITPITQEAKILQDADRMESLGAIGIARAFYTGGQLNLELFDGEDPFAEDRPLNDQKYSLDHFQVKLLKLPDMMNTPTGKELGEYNAGYLLRFMEKIEQEINGDY